jgi:hypothetical protein
MYLGDIFKRNNLSHLDEDIVPNCVDMVLSTKTVKVHDIKQLSRE